MTLALLVVSHWLLDHVTHRPDMPITLHGSERVGLGLWSLVGFLLVVYVANTFGPPPPSAAAVAWWAQALWLLVGWAYWVDNYRTPHRN